VPVSPLLPSSFRSPARVTAAAQLMYIARPCHRSRPIHSDCSPVPPPMPSSFRSLARPCHRRCRRSPVHSDCSPAPPPPPPLKTIAPHNVHIPIQFGVPLNSHNCHHSNATSASLSHNLRYHSFSTLLQTTVKRAIYTRVQSPHLNSMCASLLSRTLPNAIKA
jgi:hypothetical protein